MSSTQVRRPWRAVIRTAFQIVIALAALLPFVVDAAEIPDTIPAVAGVLVVAGAITRVMALPQVDAFLERFVPWLASDPGGRVVGYQGAVSQGMLTPNEARALDGPPDDGDAGSISTDPQGL